MKSELSHVIAAEDLESVLNLAAFVELPMVPLKKRRIEADFVHDQSRVGLNEHRREGASKLSS